jgi:hypothetical protein
MNMRAREKIEKPIEMEVNCMNKSMHSMSQPKFSKLED